MPNKPNNIHKHSYTINFKQCLHNLQSQREHENKTKPRKKSWINSVQKTVSPYKIHRNVAHSRNGLIQLRRFACWTASGISRLLKVPLRISVTVNASRRRVVTGESSRSGARSPARKLMAGAVDSGRSRRKRARRADSSSRDVRTRGIQHCREREAVCAYRVGFHVAFAVPREWILGYGLRLRAPRIPGGTAPRDVARFNRERWKLHRGRGTSRNFARGTAVYRDGFLISQLGGPWKSPARSRSLTASY